MAMGSVADFGGFEKTRSHRRRSDARSRRRRRWRESCQRSCIGKWFRRNRYSLRLGRIARGDVAPNRDELLLSVQHPGLDFLERPGLMEHVRALGHVLDGLHGLAPLRVRHAEETRAFWRGELDVLRGVQHTY